MVVPMKRVNKRGLFALSNDQCVLYQKIIENLVKNTTLNIVRALQRQQIGGGTQIRSPASGINFIH